MLYEAVRAGWPGLAERGLPARVRKEVRKYLDCGRAECGFALVRCTRCQEAMVVGFSCKGRLCPSCGARRSEETAAHCGEVLPEVPYRQWTLSLPGALRWPVVKEPRLLKSVERRLIRGIWRWQRAEAKRLGHTEELRGGAVAFAQLFGSALQLTPHLHVLVAEGLWSKQSFVGLPPPEDAEVRSILERVVRQLARDFEGLEVGWAEDGLEELQAEGAQQRLVLGEVESRRGRPEKRLAVVEGFRLHAATQVHANDRKGLERLCRYGSRGAIAEERLSRCEDGRYQYQTKRGPKLTLTAEQLVKRLLAVMPARYRHLTSFHGVFAPAAAWRPWVVRRAEELTVPAPTQTASPRPENRAKPPRMDWATLQRRTFGDDVWACHCGGRRDVVAVITSRLQAEEQLLKLGLLRRRPAAPRAQGPPQLRLAL